MPAKKKKNKRSQAKYPAIDKTVNLKTRTDLYDFDYVNGHYDEETGITTRPLNHKEKKYLNDFTEEYINADFLKHKKRIMPKKEVDHPKNSDLKKIEAILLGYFKSMNEDIKRSNITNSSKLNLRQFLTKFKEILKKKIKKERSYIKDFYKKEAFDNNNSRNRCILTRAKAQGKSIGLSEIPEHFPSDGDAEKEAFVDRVLDNMEELNYNLANEIRNKDISLDEKIELILENKDQLDLVEKLEDSSDSPSDS